MKYSCRIKLKSEHNEKDFFGSGPAKLLLGVQEYGSLKVAAQKMDMAYSKAWKIVKFAEGELGFELVKSCAGGAGGGGTMLTQKGGELLLAFVAAQEEIDKEAQEILEKRLSKILGDARIKNNDV